MYVCIAATDAIETSLQNLRQATELTDDIRETWKSSYLARLALSKKSSNGAFWQFEQFKFLSTSGGLESVKFDFINSSNILAKK